MKLSGSSLGWLSGLHRDAHAANAIDIDLVDAACAMGLMAHTTPAWTEPYVAVLDRLVEGVAARKADDEVMSLLPLLRGICSLIDTSVDRRRDRSRSTVVLTPSGEAPTLTEINELLAEHRPAGEASRVAAVAAGPDAWERLLAAPLEPCPQVVGVDLANMALDRAEWIGGNLYLGLRPLLEDPTKATSFRVVGAEPRIWDLHGVENVRMESTMSGLNVRVPMVRADVTLIRSSY